jgi:hypothetical protein
MKEVKTRYTVDMGVLVLDVFYGGQEVELEISK